MLQAEDYPGDYHDLRRRPSDINMNMDEGGDADDITYNDTTFTNNDTNYTNSNTNTNTNNADDPNDSNANQPLRRNASRVRMDEAATEIQPQQQQQQEQQQQQINPTRPSETPTTRTNNDTNTNTNTTTGTGTNTSTSTSASTNNGSKSSYMYVLFSAVCALLAIVSPPTKKHIHNRNQVQVADLIVSLPSTPETKFSFRNGPIAVSHDGNTAPGTNTNTAANNVNVNINLADIVSRISKDGMTTKKRPSQFDTVESVARALATATLSDSGVKDTTRLLKYETDIDVDIDVDMDIPSSDKTLQGSNSHSNDESNNIDNLVLHRFRPKNFKLGGSYGHDQNPNLNEQQQQSEMKNEKDSNDESGSYLSSPLKWLSSKLYKNKKKEEEEVEDEAKDQCEEKGEEKQSSFFNRTLKRIIDPSILKWSSGGADADGSNANDNGNGNANGNQDSIPINNQNKKSTKTATATQVVDKIINSTPRLIAIANLLLAGTYLLHSLVADLFLGQAHAAVGGAVAEFADGSPTMVGIGGVGASASNRIHRSGRERLAGYLLFKLLLISAVVEPDTLDLLILLSWYTLLSFLKSLSFLAGVTTAHTSSSGQTPHKGVFRLLMSVLCCDLTAAATCAALFHAAGWGMVILLTCDCALLALDVLTHLTRYFQQVLDERQQSMVAELEARQIRMHETNRSTRSLNEDNDSEEEVDNNDYLVDDNEPSEVEILSRQLDHEMEVLEATNSKRLAILDSIAFYLELTALIMTTGHFMHIWSLHGVSVNLVDGVLALHLHSALSAIGKKIAERRNHNRIARDLDNYFEDVTELELVKACAAGDVCCICLGTMSMGNVKKIGCGHIFHTNCLCEVVERARSIEAARCPLCRQSIVDGGHIPTPQSSGMPQPFIFGGLEGVVPTGTARVNVQQDDINQNRTANGQDGDNIIPGNAQQNQNERALFRFSTEAILPAWLPLPAFSFEVVRRPPLGMDTGGDNAVPPQTQPQQNTENNNNAPQQNEQEAQPQSFWRRLLILTGAVPMSPEEERNATAQLVDMFPQYERADLLRELRERGSAEAVVESVLTGIFTGVDRGGAVVDGEDIVEQVENNEEDEGSRDEAVAR